jgi:hypothetical protein
MNAKKLFGSLASLLEVLHKALVCGWKFGIRSRATALKMALGDSHVLLS